MQARSGMQLCNHDLAQVNVHVLATTRCKNVNVGSQPVEELYQKDAEALALVLLLLCSALLHAACSWC